VSDVKSTELILKYMKKSIPSGVFEEIVLESTKEYAKSLEKIAKDKQLKMLTRSERENLLKIADLLAKEKKEEVDETTNSVGGGNVAGLGVGAQGEPGARPRKKKKKINESVPMSKFAGKDVFIVDSDTYHACRLGKKQYARYEKYVGKNSIGLAIREYGLKYPKRPIILQNGDTGPMLYLKYGRS
jgi:KaiC/GvpD/RAD55 family RecA-like ATPase